MAKAYGFLGFGGPEVEAFLDLPIPEPDPGELLVSVRAAGVNPVDWKRRTGYRRPGGPAACLPAVFGNEIAGVVERVGVGVDGFSADDAVFGNPLTGGYAEYALLPVATAARKPAGLSFVDAATLPVAAATGYDGVRQLGLPAGATLLITGVGGGVGVAAAQVARHAGVRVVGTASVGKKAFVESLGVVHVESGPGAVDRVGAAAPGGVDAVFDLVGGADLEAVAELLVDRTKLISAGDGGTAARLGGGPVVRARTSAVLEEVARLVVAGVLRPFVTRTVPLGRAGEALRAVESGHAQGKIVIEVAA